VDMNTLESQHSEFRMSAGQASHFRYGYEFFAGGYQGMSMSFGVLPILNTTITGPMCYGQNDGLVVLDPSGSQPFTITWNGEIVEGMVPYVSAGTYSIVVTDADGCTLTQDVTVAEPTELTVTLNSTEGMDATWILDAYPAGGTPDYTYLWNNGSTAASIVADVPGVYSVTVYDANGCTVETEILLTKIDEHGWGHLRISPNPSNGHFTIQPIACGGNQELQIINSTGQGIERRRIPEATSVLAMDVSAYGPGVYFCRIISDSNASSQEKIIIH
jgi:hypothetical protein